MTAARVIYKYRVDVPGVKIIDVQGAHPRVLSVGADPDGAQTAIAAWIEHDQPMSGGGDSCVIETAMTGSPLINGRTQRRFVQTIVLDGWSVLHAFEVGGDAV